MRVLLSIKPEYAAKILAGEKRFEFRKVSFLDSRVKSVVIYATKPVGKVVGEFEISKVFKDSPSKIWDLTKRFAGVDKLFFDSYYQDRKFAVAIGVKSVRKYSRPLDLSDLGFGCTAPQSYRYLDGAELVTGQELLDFV